MSEDAALLKELREAKEEIARLESKHFCDETCQACWRLAEESVKYREALERILVLTESANTHDMRNDFKEIVEAVLDRK